MMPLMPGDSISAQANVALDKLLKDHPEVKKLSDSSKGMLIFPSVIMAGMGFGGEYGEGALFKTGGKHKSLANGKFYSLVSVSFGWQLGVQVRSIVMFFLTDKALGDFEISAWGGWKVGVDASVTVLTLDAGLNLDTNELTNPVVAVVTDRRGLMYSLSLEGSKISRIAR